MNLFSLVLGSGDRHYECRECGANLDPDCAVCPDCGGAVVEFDVE